MELTTGRKLSRTDRQCAFATWWNTARPQLPTDTDFEECQFLFEDAFDRAKHPLGANVLEEAVRRATTQPAPPPEAARYHSAKLQRLVSICRHLQDLAGDSPFFISVRDVARLTDTVSLQHASSLVNGLVRDGILTVVTKGSSSRRSATRFRFNSLAGQRPTT